MGRNFGSDCRCDTSTDREDGRGSVKCIGIRDTLASLLPEEEIEGPAHGSGRGAGARSTPARGCGAWFLDSAREASGLCRDFAEPVSEDRPIVGALAVHERGTRKLAWRFRAEWMTRMREPPDGKQP